MRFIVFVLSLAIAIAAPAAGEPADAQEEKVRAGAELYQRNCSPCHGPRMQDPEGAFDLRTFPADQRERFVSSIVRGKNQMPPWGDLIKPEEIDALWAYVLSERQ
jgi:mono/diheme cytochrome c family protein